MSNENYKSVESGETAGNNKRPLTTEEFMRALGAGTSVVISVSSPAEALQVYLSRQAKIRAENQVQPNE